MISSANFVIFQLTNLPVYILFVIFNNTASIIAMPEKCGTEEGSVLSIAQMQFKSETTQVSGEPMCRDRRTTVITERDRGHPNCFQYSISITVGESF